MNAVSNMVTKDWKFYKLQQYLIEFRNESFSDSKPILQSQVWWCFVTVNFFPWYYQNFNDKLKNYKIHLWLQIMHLTKVKLKVPQSCPTLWDPMDHTVHGILLARILEWVSCILYPVSSILEDTGAFPFSRGSSQPRDQTQVFRIAGGFFTSWAIREATFFFFNQVSTKSDSFGNVWI